MGTVSVLRDERNSETDASDASTKMRIRNATELYI